jgi:rubrerythrin
MTQSVKGTKTELALKAAFEGESKANRRYLYFANMADVAGAPDVASVFRSTAEGETGHAHGHMEYLIDGGSGDPETGLPAATVEQALESAIAGETHEYQNMYPGMAKTAREEGFEEIADWFHTLAMAERSHAKKFTKTLETYKAEEM